MRKRKKVLKNIIKNLQQDNDYAEYWMGICYDREELKKLQNRMDANYMLISEIRFYLAYLQPKSKKLFLKGVMKKENL